MSSRQDLQHFILTRFNIRLWQKDKKGNTVRTNEWLSDRFLLFERYCLPSMAAQTNKSFIWIVLFDATTPGGFKSRIKGYQVQCPQLIPIYVTSENGRYFAQIFKAEVSKRLNANRVITTYLDNDDALRTSFVEDLQNRAIALPDETFISYTDGYQYFTDYGYLMHIHYPRNHFVSVVEKGDASLKTIYGYGSHYFIEKIPGAKIEYVPEPLMWCEVIHEKNMGNDAYFLMASMVNDIDLLRRDFSLDEDVKSGIWLYLFRFLPRYIVTLVRRTRYFFFGRKW